MLVLAAPSLALFLRVSLSAGNNIVYIYEHSLYLRLNLIMAPNRMQKNPQDSPSGPRSLLRIFKILELIAQNPNGLTLTDLATQLAAPKSSLSALLKPLVAHQYLRYEQSRYGLGSQVFRLSAEILSARSFTRIIQPFLEELSVASTESVYVVMIDRNMGLASYVEGIESQNPIRYVAPRGTVRPLYVSAAGKALLAFQEESWREHYLKTTTLISPSTKQPIDLEALISVNEAVPGAAGLAAPILVAGQPVSAALLISAPADRLVQSLSPLKIALKDIAQSASAHLASVNYAVSQNIG
jgi:DNA-binding IclR family transcriptional regulator